MSRLFSMFRKMLNEEVGGKTVKEHNRRWVQKVELETQGFVFEVSITGAENPYCVSLPIDGSLHLLGAYKHAYGAIKRAMKESMNAN